MAKDNFFQARLSEELKADLDLLIEEENNKNPLSNVTVSSVARYALEKFVKEYIDERDGNKIHANIDTWQATSKDISTFIKLIKEVESNYREQNPDPGDKVNRMFITLSLHLTKACMHKRELEKEKAEESHE